MSAQNCQARLLFKDFTLTCEYYWFEESIFEFGGGIPNRIESFTANGTWGHKALKLDFTKRELSCPSLLSQAKTSATDGWAHKQIDAPIVRDFSMGFPYPAFGQGEGQEYSADYYVDQRYPNETGYIPEAVPLIDRIRTRQPLVPILTQAWLSGPYYFLDDSGFPPNLNQDYYALTPNTAVFESKDAYKAWLQTWLEGTRSPVYFPGAPNDPEPTANPRTVATLFPTKAAWLTFRDSAGGRGNGLCGGNAQCGVQFFLVNDPGAVVNLESSVTGGFFPDRTGTAISRAFPVDFFRFTDNSLINHDMRGIFRELILDVEGKTKVSASGLPEFGPWKVYPDAPSGLADVQQLQNYMGRLEPLGPGAGISLTGSGFPFFNKNQKACSQFSETVAAIDLPQKWTLDPKPAFLLPVENATPDFEQLNITTAGWDGLHETVFEKLANEVSWTTSASAQESGGGYTNQFAMRCKIKITWTDV